MSIPNRVANCVIWTKRFILMFPTGIEKRHGNSSVVILARIEKFVRNLEFPTVVQNHIGNSHFDIMIAHSAVARVGRTKCALCIEEASCAFKNREEFAIRSIFKVFKNRSQVVLHQQLTYVC